MDGRPGKRLPILCSSKLARPTGPHLSYTEVLNSRTAQCYLNPALSHAEGCNLISSMQLTKGTCIVGSSPTVEPSTSLLPEASLRCRS